MPPSENATPLLLKHVSYSPFQTCPELKQQATAPGQQVLSRPQLWLLGGQPGSKAAQPDRRDVWFKGKVPNSSVASVIATFTLIIFVQDPLTLISFF